MIVYTEELLRVCSEAGIKYQRHNLPSGEAISYRLNLNLLAFTKKLKLNLNVNIIGLPISVDTQGFNANNQDIEKLASSNGLTVVLNADSPFSKKANTLSSFEFQNRFSTKENYLKSLRSPYRRRVNTALKKAKDLRVREISNRDFTNNHYELYKSVFDRSDYKLELLPILFFQSFEAKILEILDKDQNILAFIQIKELEDKLIFMFCGFKALQSELYQYLLLCVLFYGIENGFRIIDFGQTSDECKLKLGCKEVKKYMYIAHKSNIITSFLQLLLPIFSYKSHKNKYNVFKEVSL